MVSFCFWGLQFENITPQQSFFCHKQSQSMSRHLYLEIYPVFTETSRQLTKLMDVTCRPELVSLPEWRKVLGCWSWFDIINLMFFCLFVFFVVWQAEGVIHLKGQGYVSSLCLFELSHLMIYFAFSCVFNSNSGGIHGLIGLCWSWFVEEKVLLVCFNCVIPN